MCIDKEFSEESHTLIIISGSSKNLVPGLFAYLIVAMGAKAKYIFIFWASSGMVENAIKPEKKKYVNMDIKYPRANKMPILLLPRCFINILLFSN